MAGIEGFAPVEVGEIQLVKGSARRLRNVFDFIISARELKCLFVADIITDALLMQKYPKRC